MTDEATLRRVLERVEQVTGKAPKKTGQSWSCLCPAHGDKSASLSVAAGQKGVTLKCFAGCEFSAIVRALGMEEKDFFYTTRPQPSRQTTPAKSRTPRPRKRQPKDRGTPTIVQKELRDYVWAYEVTFPDGATHLVKSHVERGVHCDCEAWRFKCPCSHVGAVANFRDEPVPPPKRASGQAGQSRGGAAGVGADTCEGSEPSAAAENGENGDGTRGRVRSMDGDTSAGDGEVCDSGLQEVSQDPASSPRAPLESKEGNADATPVGRLTVEALAEAKGLDPAILAEWGVVEKDRVVFIPYKTADGRLWPRVHVRFTLEKGSDRFRWWPNREAGWELADGEPRIIPYGLWMLENVAYAGGVLVIVEGETDCWALWSHGILALGLPSASVASVLQAAHLADVTTIYLVREPDRGGDTLTRALGERLVELNWPGMAYVMTCGEQADVADLLATSRQSGGAGFDQRDRDGHQTAVPPPVAGAPTAAAAGSDLELRLALAPDHNLPT